MKIGIIGCGNIARTHAAIIKRYVSNATIVFCDRNKDKVDRLTKTFGAQAGCTTVEDLLRGEQPEAVHILTQPQSHALLAEQALLAGAHVYIEKPVTQWSSEYSRLVELAKQNGKYLCPGYSYLGMPAVRRSKEIIESKDFGCLIAVHCDFNLTAPRNQIPYGRPDHWAYSLRGGILQNIIDHPASLVIDAMDGIQDHRTLVGRRRALPNDSPDLIHLCFGNREQMGSLTISFGHGNTCGQIHYFLEGATLMVDVRRHLVAVATGRGPQGVLRSSVKGLKQAWDIGSGSVGTLLRRATGALPQNPGIAGLIRNFYATVAGGEKLIVSEATAAQVITVLEHVWEEVETQTLSREEDRSESRFRAATT